METKRVEVSVPDYEKSRTYVQGVHDAADELYEIETEVKQATEEFKKRIAPLEEEAASRREGLLKLMQDARQKHIDVADGQKFYVRATKSSFEVTDEEAAMKWAKKEGLLRLDKVGANKVLLRMPKTPKGFEEKITEHLKLQTSKDE